MFDKNESGLLSVRAVLTANYGLCGETADEIVSSLRASIQRAVSDGLLQGHSIVSSVESWEVSVGTEIPRIHPAPVKTAYLLVHAGEPQPGEPEDWYTHKDGGFLYESEHARNPVAVFENPDHAKRIVACLNACKGFSTEQLEDRRFIEPVNSAGEVEGSGEPGLYPTCSTCGGKDLALEATVHWTPGKGAEVGTLCDGGHYCGTCEGETKLEWVGAEPPSPEAGQVRRWTVWVVEKKPEHRTTFTTSCEAETAEAAGELAIEEAAESFGQPASELRVLGVAAGEVNLVIWDDDN